MHVNVKPASVAAAVSPPTIQPRMSRCGEEHDGHDRGGDQRDVAEPEVRGLVDLVGELGRVDGDDRAESGDASEVDPVERRSDAPIAAARVS